jgi:hypothetical protein
LNPYVLVHDLDQSKAEGFRDRRSIWNLAIHPLAGKERSRKVTDGEAELAKKIDESGER